MKRFRILMFVVALVSAACGGKLYEVHSETTPRKGIPFYVVAGNCTQETVYLETIYQVALVVPAEGTTPPFVVMEQNFTEKVYVSAEMTRLKEAITNGATLTAVGALFNTLPRYIQTEVPETEDEVILVSNVNKPGTYVNYGAVHYVNVNKPRSGSASATAKLSSDGTLTEATAAVEDKTLETVLATLPIKEALLGVITGGGSGTRALGLGVERAHVQLIATPMRFKHILTRTTPGDGTCKALLKIEIDAKDANRRREAVGDSSAGEKSDENAIGVAGKIVPPKKGGGLLTRGATNCVAS